jgi:hypothetical protein
LCRGLLLPEKVGLDAVPPNQQADLNGDPEKLGRKETEIFVIAGETVCMALDELDGECKYITRYQLPTVPIELSSNDRVFPDFILGRES